MAMGNTPTFKLFQHTAARRRLVSVGGRNYALSTGFNTQPPEGGWVDFLPFFISYRLVSTHSRPKAAGITRSLKSSDILVFQHTAARRRLAPKRSERVNATLFQHTAARRRLVYSEYQMGDMQRVSTHSRPKAAGAKLTPFLH